MNILPCLVLCVASASCLSNESAGTTVDANSGIFYKGDLHEYLFHHKDFKRALRYFCEVMETFLTGRLMLDLNASIECAAKELGVHDRLINIDASMRITSNECLCYCRFYVKKIGWIKKALLQGNYSAADIVENILLLSAYTGPLAALGARWRRSAKETLGDGTEKIAPELDALLAKISKDLETLDQSQWTASYTSMVRYGVQTKLKYGEQATLLTKELMENYLGYTAAFTKFIASYLDKKVEFAEELAQSEFAKKLTRSEFAEELAQSEFAKKLTRSEFAKKLAQSEKALEDEFLRAFEDLVEAPYEEFQEGLTKIGPSTPLKLPEDTEEVKKQKKKEDEKERADITFKILRGGVKKFESIAAKADTKEPAGAIEGVEDQVAETDVEDQVVGNDAEDQTGEDGTGQVLEQKKGKARTKLQEKKDAKGEAKKEEGKMLKYAGGTAHNSGRMPRRFAELLKKFEEGCERMTYKEVRELFSLRVLRKLGISTGCLFNIHNPHGRVCWGDYVSWKTHGICKTQWDSFKSRGNYAELLKKIEECMWEK